MFSKILSTIDGSSSSIYALNYAANLANQSNAELTILSVIEPIPSFYTAGSGNLGKEMHETTLKNYLKMQNEQCERLLAEYPNLKVFSLIEDGKPAEVIRDVSSDFDLIVIGHRGLGGVLDWVLGSVAKQVVDTCTVPVLVVKEKAQSRAQINRSRKITTSN